MKWSYLSIRAAPPVSLSSLCLHVLLSNTKNTSRDSHFEYRFVLAYSFAACILYFHHQRQSINHHHSPFINVHGYPTDPTIRFVAFLFVVVGLHIVKDSFHNSLVTFFNRLLLDGFVRVLFRFGWFVVVVVGWT